MADGRLPGSGSAPPRVGGSVKKRPHRDGYIHTVTARNGTVVERDAELAKLCGPAALGCVVVPDLPTSLGRARPLATSSLAGCPPSGLYFRDASRLLFCIQEVTGRAAIDAACPIRIG